LRKIILVLTFVSIIAGCAGLEVKSKPAAVQEIHPGILAGYLDPEALPNSLALLPPPPAEGSAAYALDEEASRKSFAFRDTPRWDLAARDAELMFPEAAGTFSCALGIPVTESDTPHLYMLLRRTLADAGLSTYTAKNHYQRKRPFMVNKAPICTPAEDAQLRKDGSYPSGHTAIGWAWALILTEIAPDRADAILARGRAFGESRVVCNVHWHSDVVEGRFMGAAAVARLNADSAFRAEMEAARVELAAVRGKGLEPKRDCRAESEGLILGMELEHGGIEGSRWYLVEVCGSTVSPLAAEKQPYILFDPSRKMATGFAGCNHFFGGYELDGFSLKFKDIGSTRMACPDLQMGLETEFVRALERTRAWKISDQGLLLLRNSEVLARFSEENIQGP